MKRTLLSTMAMAAAIILTGCSDTPSEGMLDTQVVRDVATIETLSGKAYGLMEGAPKAIKAFNEDTKTLIWAEDRAWRHLVKNGSLEGFEFALTYPGIDRTQMDKLLAETKSKAQSEYDKVVAEIQADIDQTRSDAEAAKAELVKLTSSDDAFKKAVATEQEAYDKVRQELNAARADVQKIYQRAATDMAKLAERLGFTGRRSLSFDEDLIAEYKVLDYTGRNDLPKDCPPQRNHEAVDIRDLTNQCAYLRMGTIWFRDQAVEKEARKILSTNFRALAEMMHKIGDDGRRGEVSGINAKLAERKKALESAYAEAAKEHGSKQEREAAIAKLDRKIQALEAKLSKISKDEYVYEQTRYMDLESPEGFKDASKAYINAMRIDLFKNHIVAVSDITMDPEESVKNGHFENLSDDHVAVIAVTEIKASRMGSSDLVRGFGFKDLKDPKIAEMDRVVMPLNGDTIDRVRSRDTEEDVQGDVIQYLTRVYKDRKVS